MACNTQIPTVGEDPAVNRFLNTPEPVFTTHMETVYQAAAEVGSRYPEQSSAPTGFAYSNRPRGTDDNIDDRTDPVSRLADILTKLCCLSPRPKPEKLRGDKFNFELWLQSFEALVEIQVTNLSELLYYLRHYTSGEAKELVKGYLPIRIQAGFLSTK